MLTTIRPGSFKLLLSKLLTDNDTDQGRAIFGDILHPSTRSVLIKTICGLSNIRITYNLHSFLTGVKVTGVETVRLATSQTKDSVSAEDTHFESHGHRGACIVYAIRLYVDDECGALSKKDLNPEPKNVKLTDHHCILL